MSVADDVLLQRQKVLADFGDFALQSEDLDEVLTEACRLVGEAMATGRAKVLEIEPGGASLFVRAGVGWAAGVVGRTHIPMRERSSESYSIEAGEPVISRDINKEDRFAVPGFMKDAGVVALANVPILLPGGRPYGLLQIDDTKPREFNRNDTEFLRTYATLLGPVIDRLLKLQQLRSTEERFRLTVEAATDYAIMVTDEEDRIADWLPGAAAVFGWSAEEVLGRPAAILFTPEDRESGEPKKELEVARRDGYASDVRWHQRKDGSRVFIEGSVRVLHDFGGVRKGFLKIGRDITKQREADDRLRASEESFRSLSELVPALLWQMNPGGEEVTLNPRWLAYTGQTLEDTQNWGWLDAVHPDDRETTGRIFAEAFRSGEPLELQHRLRGRDGEYRWFLVRQTPTRDAEGKVARWFGAAIDVDELRQLQEHQEVMVAELQHRTRNLIGVVRSIARQTMADSEHPVGEFDRRLAALSRVQGLLSRAEQKPITLRALVEQELDALGAEGEQVTLQGPSVRLRSTVVQTLALALHELATNSRKHGALSDGAGRLSVQWRLGDRDGERRLRIEWREEGFSPRNLADPSLTQRGGYGRQLIERALPYALKAETTFELEPARLRCTIDLPLGPPRDLRSI